MQAKQKGLVESGRLADDQYKTAIKSGQDSGNYDPTSVMEFIDNSEMAPNFVKSDAAKESQAAQSAWVETYLRDASGAAIPQSERMSYAKDFFPRPGDSETTVTNKQNLREQKRLNAQLASGDASGVSSDQSSGEQKIPAKRLVNKKTGQVKIIYNDGSEETR